MFYEERRCEHGNWWYRDEPTNIWHKFTNEMLLKKLNEEHDRANRLQKQIDDETNNYWPGE